MGERRRTDLHQQKCLDPWGIIFTLPVPTLFERQHGAQAHLQDLNWPHHTQHSGVTRGDARQQEHAIDRRCKVVAATYLGTGQDSRRVEVGTKGHAVCNRQCGVGIDAGGDTADGD